MSSRMQRPARAHSSALRGNCFSPPCVHFWVPKFWPVCDSVLLKEISPIYSNLARRIGRVFFFFSCDIVKNAFETISTDFQQLKGTDIFLTSSHITHFPLPLQFSRHFRLLPVAIASSHRSRGFCPLPPWQSFKTVLVLEIYFFSWQFFKSEFL